MKLLLHHADIVQAEADALVYSTNVQLMLSGGVGACLLEKFGADFQTQLYRNVDKEGRKYADVGEVFYTELENGPWKLIAHTIAADPFYHTDPEVVASLVSRVFETCVTRGDIRSIVMSPLGAGYGDLELSRFVEIVTKQSNLLDGTNVRELTVCCDSLTLFKELAEAAAGSEAKWVISEQDARLDR